MTGAEYLSAEVLASLWRCMGQALDAELAESGCPLQEFLKRRNPAWNLVGRVHFNLAENRKDPDAPFAFLATYTPGCRRRARPSTCRSGRRSEYAGAANKDAAPVAAAAGAAGGRACAWLKAMVDAGEIFHPAALDAGRGLAFLRDVPRWKAPAWWCACRRPGA